MRDGVDNLLSLTNFALVTHGRKRCIENKSTVSSRFLVLMNLVRVIRST